MTDCNSRLSVFNRRTDAGIDTHRDDIGTLAERMNTRRAKTASYKKGNKHYFAFVAKIDILMTLLEDGKIDNITFGDEYKKNQVAFQNKMDKGIVKSTMNQNEVHIHHHFKKRKTVDRLRQLHSQKYGCNAKVWL